MKTEIYVSTDIETDGPIPGVNSMLSFASVAFTAAGPIQGAPAFFTANLDILEGGRGNPKTDLFWATHQAAYNATRTNLQAPADAMAAYSAWLENLPGRPVFVAYPAGFDFTFVYLYLQRFTGGCPFGFSALDMKTFAMVLLGRDYRQSTKKVFPKGWFPSGLPHTHVALDDAREQAAICMSMLREAEGLRRRAREYEKLQDELRDAVVGAMMTRPLPVDAIGKEVPVITPGMFSEGEPGVRPLTR